MRQEPQPAVTRLALEAPGNIVRQRDDLVSRGEDELPWMQDERLLAVCLHQAGQVGLLHRRVDVRVLVVLEHPEVAVESHVNAGRLDAVSYTHLRAHETRHD